MPNSFAKGFPGDSVAKNPPASARDQGSIPELGRHPEGGNGNSLQYSFLEVLRTEEPGSLQIHGVAKEPDPT